MRGIIP
ncbi:hypothetical protein CP061683_1310A, partial [Chlamydia psittaci 06-1683]